MPVGRFLGGVGALVFDPATEKYLLLKRSAATDVGAGRWECVAGRLEQGEGFEEALHREVREEIGARVQIEFLLSTTHFYRGEPKPENELIGVIYSCTLDGDQKLQCSDEHSEMRWMSREEIAAFLPPDHWLRAAVERAEWLRPRLASAPPPPIPARPLADTARRSPG